MGKTVAEQANAGFSEVWRRSDLLMAIEKDDELMDFTDLMTMVVTQRCCLVVSYTTRQTIDKHSCTVVRCLHYIPAPY